MTFSFIDQISAMGVDRAVGILHRDERAAPILPWLVVEAVGQLAGWIAMHRTDFTRRPFAALVGEICLTGVEARGDIELEAHIQRLDARAILYSGAARCAGGEIAKLSRCVGPLMAMDHFDDPAAVAARFAALRGETPAQDFHVDTTVQPELSPVVLRSTSAVSRLDVPAEAAFFADHFPRRPVYPASLLAAALSQVAAPLAAQSLGATPSGVRLVRLFDYKVRSFSPPGQSLDLAAAERVVGDGGVVIDVSASAQDKRVAGGTLEFRLAPTS